MKIKEIKEASRPREKMKLYGPGRLADHELLSILIESGTKKYNASELANIILNKFANSIHDLLDISVEELTKIEGIGFARASKIVAASELAKRINTHEVKNEMKITSSKSVIDLYSKRFAYEKKENFLALLIDTKGKIISEEKVSVGDLSSSIVHPREAFRLAIKKSAASVIFLHNHPSGDPAPSMQDIEITKRLVKVGNIVGIEVLDHIIIGKGKSNSLRDMGII